MIIMYQYYDCFSAMITTRQWTLVSCL